MRELIGARLKEERERLGYNQVDFAAAGGASNRSQVDWEKGKQVPNAEFLALVAEIGVDVQYIVMGVRSNVALTEDEEQLLTRYRALHIQDKANVLLNAAFTEDERELITGYRALDLRSKAGVLGMVEGLGTDPSSTASKKQVQPGNIISGKVIAKKAGVIQGNNISGGKMTIKLGGKKK